MIPINPCAILPPPVVSDHRALPPPPPPPPPGGGGGGEGVEAAERQPLADHLDREIDRSAHHGLIGIECDSDIIVCQRLQVSGPGISPVKDNSREGLAYECASKPMPLRLTQRPEGEAPRRFYRLRDLIRH